MMTSASKLQYQLPQQMLWQQEKMLRCMCWYNGQPGEELSSLPHKDRSWLFALLITTTEPTHTTATAKSRSFRALYYVQQWKGIVDELLAQGQ